MPTNYITLTRQALYDMVWSTPMRRLAQDFGITDVALAKRCRLVDVPVPPRGWWARKAAGQNPPRIPLPKYRRSGNAEPLEPAPARQTRRSLKSLTRTGPEPTVHFGRPPPGTFSTPDVAASPEEQAFRDRLVAITVTTPDTLSGTVTAVRRTARFRKHPDRASLSFARGESTGPILDISVTLATLDRALLFADRLVRTAQQLGWQLTAPRVEATSEHTRTWQSPHRQPKPLPRIARLTVDGIDIEFRIEERTRMIPEPAKQPQTHHANQYSPSTRTYEGTGRLRLACLEPSDYDNPRRSWGDRDNVGLEDKLPEILWHFQQLAIATQRKREKAAEAARLRVEKERRELELSIQRGHHAKLVEVLETQAGAWYRATLLRRYLRVLRRVAGEGQLAATLGDQRVDFLLWAEQYVNQLDPFHPAPRVEEMMPASGWEYRLETELRSQIARLLGRQWHQSYKVGNAKLGDQTAARD